MTARRRKGEGGIFQKANGLWVGRIEGEPDPTTGKRTRIEVTSMNHATMMDKLDTAKRELAGHGYVSDKQQKFSTWAEAWLTEQTHTLRPKTWATYASLLRKWVIPVIGTKPIAAITDTDIRKIRDQILKAGRSSTTALQAFRVVHHCLEDARRARLITENVCTRITPPRKAATKRGAFTVAETKTILRTAATMPQGSRFITQLLAGLRQSEVLGLTIPEVDLDGGTATITWQQQEMSHQHGCGDPDKDGAHPCGYKQPRRCPESAWRMPEGFDYLPLTTRYALVAPKSKHGFRSVPLLPPVVAAIRHHLETDWASNPHGLIWCNPDSTPIGYHEDGTAWKELMRASGQPDNRTTHWARHSVATMLMEAGVDAHVVGEIVGHGSVAVTRKYQHVSSEAAKDAMRKLGELLA